VTTRQTQESSLEQRCRRRARSEGMSITKVREGSPDYVMYGPFMIIDGHTNVVEASGLGLIDIADEFGAWKPGERDAFLEEHYPSGFDGGAA